MKKTRIFYGFYEYLTLAERLGLLTAAYERHDVHDVLSIEKNCPFEDFGDFVANILELKFAAGLTVIQLLAREVFITLMLQRLVDQADVDSGFDQMLMDHLARQAAIWGGFVAWCRDHGHKPRRVLHLLPIAWDERDPACFLLQYTIERIEVLSQSANGSIPDPELVQEYHHMFDDIFVHEIEDVVPVDEDGEFL